MQDDLISLFLEDSREYLADIETDLLDLEEAGADFDSELVNRVFRAAHSIKGSASFLGLNKIRDLSHKIENVLDMIRTREIAPTKEVINVVLASFDKLEELVENNEESNEADIEEYVAALTALVKDGLPEESRPNLVTARDISLPGGRVVFSVPEHDLAQARKGGSFVYLVEYDLIHDVHKKGQTPLDLMKFLGKSGMIVDCKLDVASVGGLDAPLTNRIPLYVLYSTILEPDLVNAVFQVGKEHIHNLDAEPSPEAVEEDGGGGVQEAARDISDDFLEEMEKRFDDAMAVQGKDQTLEVTPSAMQGAARMNLGQNRAEPEAAAGPLEEIEGYPVKVEGDGVSIKLEPEMTIESGERLKNALLAAIRDYKEVRLDLAAVERADLCFLQLLISARLTAKDKGVEVYCLADNGAVSEAAKRVGFDLAKAGPHSLEGVFR